eukprot:GHUV01004364.1.p2 GENE.GHUV01004364.1~~GHUV01004364.1.p2  ORF type:complete len:103 (-),score=11.59 GHUV01004364.1:1134-1442(-)
MMRHVRSNQLAMDWHHNEGRIISPVGRSGSKLCQIVRCYGSIANATIICCTAPAGPLQTIANSLHITKSSDLIYSMYATAANALLGCATAATPATAWKQPGT